MPTRAYIRPGLVYMAGSEQRNCVVVVFLGRQRNASCSSGGNRTRVVHREPTGLDGIADGNEAWCTAERRKRPCVRPAMVETGSCSSGGVWRTAKRRKRASYGRNGVLLIASGVAYRKTEEWTCVGALLFIGRGVAYHKTGLHGILFISIVDPSSPRGLLFIHRRPPPASTCDCSSTGSCSSSLHRALLHRLLFNQPSPRAHVQPPLHGLLFIQPSTV